MKYGDRTAFQNLKEQNEELALNLAEREAYLEELTNLVSTKDQAIKNMERRLLHAKKIIADLKAEVQSLRSSNELQEPDHQQQTAQQQSETEVRCVSAHGLSSIHSRYQKVLQVLTDNRCSMANAFCLAGCPRSTVCDFVAIAKLKIVDHREHDRVIHDHAGSVKELEAICKTRLWRYLPVMVSLWLEGKLLPLKFTYIHTYIPTYLPTLLPTYLPTYIHTYINFISIRIVNSTIVLVQYCAKVMPTIIDEYREYRNISAIFNEILP